VYLWDLIGIKLTKFSSPKSQPDPLAVDRTVDQTKGRSTGPVDRYARERAHGQRKRPVDRLKAPNSRVLAGRPGGQPQAWPRRPGG